ncbi:hypothetical protein HZH68_013068 [Vespula germanica]|uniref:Uncharacterized protein n=1 Tax=Vespula germanica TaxID=30212 RepID=A0A834JL60_VESGE|nr:hypothetical protein HZH68_013068 [Vespula germanica]
MNNIICDFWSNRRELFQLAKPAKDELEPFSTKSNQKFTQYSSRSNTNNKHHTCLQMTTTDFKCNYCKSVYAVYFCKDFAKLSPNNVLELANYIAQMLLQVFGRFEGIVMREKSSAKFYQMPIGL